MAPSLLPGDRIHPVVEHPGGSADGPAETTNDKAVESGSLGIYHINFAGSYDEGIHIIVCDIHKSLAHVR